MPTTVTYVFNASHIAPPVASRRRESCLATPFEILPSVWGTIRVFAIRGLWVWQAPKRWLLRVAGDLPLAIG